MTKKMTHFLLVLFSVSILTADEYIDYPGYGVPGYGRKVVLISGCQEYRSEETLTQLAKILAQNHGFHCRVLFTQDLERPGFVDPEPAINVPGLEALKTADLMIIHSRFMNLPDEQMRAINDYLVSGRPVLGLRTGNHGFRIPEESKWAHYDWQYEGPKKEWHGGFGQIIFGGKFIDHHGHKMHESTRGLINEVNKDHNVLLGLEGKEIWGTSFVYGINLPLREDCEVLVYGQVLEGMEPDSPVLGPKTYTKRPKSMGPDSKGKNDPMMPLAWTSEYQIPQGRKGRAFHTTLGASEDFASEGVRRLIVNGAFWLLAAKPPESGCDVELVGDFKPSPYGFHRSDGWEKKKLAIKSFQHEIKQEPIQKPAYDFLNPSLGKTGTLYGNEKVNRYRLYNFYSRQAEAMMDMEDRPKPLPGFPGLDSGTFGHWGAYHKNDHSDRRFDFMAHSSMVATTLKPDGLGRGVKNWQRIQSIKLGDSGLNCGFDTQGLRMILVWEGDFLQAESGRWGAYGGVAPKGQNWLRQNPGKAEGKFVGFYQYEDKNVLAYQKDGCLIWEHPWYNENGFIRNLHFPEGASSVEIELPTADSCHYSVIHQEEIKASLVKNTLMIEKASAGSTLILQASKHKNTEQGTPKVPNFKTLTAGGTDLWEWEFKAAGKLAVNKHGAHVQDSIPVPLHNPYGSSIMLTGVSFFKDGRAAVCTLQGDVWIISGLDNRLDKVVWKRFATGIEIALGLLIINDKIHVAGRDRITRLHDLNNDGMADYYENFCQNYRGGRTVGLQKDRDNNVYFTANGKTMKVSADGETVTPLIVAGQRNTNGTGASLDGVVLSSANEGDWTPASLIFEAKEGDNYSVAKRGKEADLPMAFVPRAIDNSTGSQIFVEDERWGYPEGVVVSTCFGSGVVYGLLRDTHWERTQGAVFPIKFDFASGTHRGSFAPHDGQLYLVGSDGWGNYAIVDGHFDRLRYTGDEILDPVAWRAHENGIELTFSTELDQKSIMEENFFLQQWTYQYSKGYGSHELSLESQSNENTNFSPGHDEVAISRIKLSSDQKTLWIGVPDIQPVETLHIHARLKSKSGKPFLLDSFHTLLHLDQAHPEMPARITKGKTTIVQNIRNISDEDEIPWRKNNFPKSIQPREIIIESVPGLKYRQSLVSVKANEPLKIMFSNRDNTMSHNLVFVKPGTLEKVGLASDELLKRGLEGAAKKHYVPDSEDVLFYTSMQDHWSTEAIYVNAPDAPGDYPFVCTVPGHWRIMTGILRVK